MKNSEQLQSSASKSINIDQKLVEEGISQLGNEIRVLENWLDELKTKNKSDSEAIAVRKSYHDMLRSRREMLNALNKHTRDNTQ
ncbi:MAG: hypothetical protein JKY98_04305 [Gammaproteobacteria bacterium]|nr:hypothetical protein [Gammaproteobacteria bacterium]